MTFVHAAAFSAGFALRWTWFLFLPVIGVLALMGAIE